MENVVIIKPILSDSNEGKQATDMNVMNRGFMNMSSGTSTQTQSCMMY